MSFTLVNGAFQYAQIQCFHLLLCLPSILLSFYLSTQTTFTLYVCDMTRRIGGGCEVTGAANIKEM